MVVIPQTAYDGFNPMCNMAGVRTLAVAQTIAMTANTMPFSRRHVADEDDFTLPLLPK
jgi:hypothetical protein